MRSVQGLAKFLFLEKIEGHKPFEFPHFSSEEQEKVKNVFEILEKLKTKINSSQFDERKTFPTNYIEQLCDLGLMGLTVPEEFGGLGLKNSSYIRVLQEVASIDGATIVTMAAHQSIGFKALSLFGTEEQKKKYYADLACGKKLACFALTEPGSGSDAASIQTKAVLNAEGTHYCLNGEKIWITNADLSNLITVFAKTAVQKPNGETKDQVTAFIVELPTAGISFGPPEDKMGLRASRTTSVILEDVMVPIENVLGKPGDGFKIAMEVLNNGRIGAGAGSVGVSKKLLQMASKQSLDRIQFGKSINKFGLIQEKIAQMTVDTFVAESMLYYTAARSDLATSDFSLEAAMLKVFATESLWKSVNDTLQIFGGMGYMREAGIEQILRDVRANLIFEGTNEICRLFIAMTGIQTFSENLKNPLGSFGRFLNKAGPLKKILSKKRKGISSHFTQVVSEFTSMLQKFEFQIGRYLIQNRKCKGKDFFFYRQMECKKIADASIDLFAVLATVIHIESISKHSSAEKEILLLLEFWSRAKLRIQENLQQLFNLPHHELVSEISSNQSSDEKFIWDSFFNDNTVSHAPLTTIESGVKSAIDSSIISSI